MKAVIMAGGEGSRLRPLTCDRPKPMVPVMNRPLMEYSVELLQRHGFREIAVTLQYLPDQIKEHFGSGGRFGVNLHYFVEEEPLGTAGSVKNAAAMLDETFVVLSGDALTDFNLTAAVELHRARGAVATLVLKSVENPLEYGVVMIGPDGRVNRFLEKPGWGEVFSDTVNTGIYILEPEVLSLIETGRMVDFSRDLFPRLLEMEEPLFGCVLEGFWCDIGDLREYLRAHREILAGRVEVQLKGREHRKGIWMEEGVSVHPRSQLSGPLYLGAGCHIGEGVRLGEGTVLGPHTRAVERSSVKRGLTWEGAYLGRKAALRGGILCRGVQLGEGAAVYEEAVVGNGTLIEEGAVIKPGVKVWPAKVIESGVTLNESLIWGTSVSRALFGRHGIQGEINREITPEMVVRLGAVFGSTMPGPVLVSGDADKPSVTLQKALVAGLLSAGAAVLDAGELLIPMARRATTYLQASGGIHLACFSGDRQVIRLSFFDADGLPLSRNMERKIEQLYYREDFPRASGDALGELLRLPDMAEIYRAELLQKISFQKLSRAGLRVVLGNPTSYLRRFLIPLLQELSCTVITVNSAAGGSPGELSVCRGGEELQSAHLNLAAAVRRNSATLGVVLTPGGERALLFDERGKAVQGDLYTALLSLLVFREQRGGTVAVPVHVSQVIEKLAERYQGRVLRTKAAPRSLMAPGKEQGASGKGPPNLAASLPFDGIAALVYLLDLLAGQDLTLTGLLEEIPAIKTTEKEIPCPWTMKGRVMRRLIQESANKKTEMIDGLKVYHPQGWALVLPDPERPSYHVYSEAFSEEFSDSLTDLYVQKIDALLKET
ncbi:MAG: NTP transferase domain-containing protein [Firmicutes bacterium]|nr:NTP transferase domain-containing protein [Bacillota bacterium]